MKDFNEYLSTIKNDPSNIIYLKYNLSFYLDNKQDLIKFKKQFYTSLDPVEKVKRLLPTKKPNRSFNTRGDIGAKINVFSENDFIAEVKQKLQK